MSRDAKIVAVFAAIIVGIWFAYPFGARRLVGCSKTSCSATSADSSGPWEDSGQHGDTYGGFTSLFTALAFLSAGYAVYLQHRELGAQRRNMAAGRVPAISWDAPTIRVIGLISNADSPPALALSLSTVICNAGSDSAINFFSCCTLYTSAGKEIAVGAASSEGSSFESGDCAMGFHHIVIKDEACAASFLKALIERDVVNLKFEGWCTNTIASPFYRAKTYVVDCPSNVSRDFCRRLLQRLNARAACPIDLVSMQNYAHGVSVAVVEGRNQFTNEYASAVSKIEPMVSKMIEPRDYERAQQKVHEVLKECVFPMRDMRQSFYIPWKSCSGVGPHGVP